MDMTFLSNLPGQSFEYISFCVAIMCRIEKEYLTYSSYEGKRFLMYGFKIIVQYANWVHYVSSAFYLQILVLA